MFDAPTNVDLNPDGPGLVLDVSGVFHTPALAAVMACAAAWVTETVARRPTRTLVVLDEAWALLRIPAVCRWLAATAKLSRALGVALVLVAHRASDFTAQAEAGSAAREQARGLLADVETRVVYAQAPGEARAAAEILGLDTLQAELITQLPAHRALWLVGARAAVVDHVLSGFERAAADTDTRMTAKDSEFAVTEGSRS
jgi:hypothetical protein